MMQTFTLKNSIALPRTGVKMSIRLQLQGQKFGRLTVVEFAGVNKNQRTMWRCLCDCGRERIVMGYKLVSGHTTSCGCLRNEHLSELFKGRFVGKDNPNYGNKWSETQKKKMSITVKELFKDKNNHPMYGKHHSGETKRKISKSRKRNWEDPEYQKMQREAQNLKPNKPEQALMELLNKLFPNEYKYVGDYQFWLGGKNPDFMNINGQKKIIELYGDWWHKGQDPQDRIDHFKQYGFDTSVIWEHELKNELELRKTLIEFHELQELK